MLRGWAQVMQGDSKRGITVVREGVTCVRAQLAHNFTRPTVLHEPPKHIGLRAIRKQDCSLLPNGEMTVAIGGWLQNSIE